ncbi:hypothetical protein HYW83_01210 [Candidatus Peregrinibacteria bacterium]|nr:hypothetical protein [Candidatus Peregrinibacteria bacterium]
MICRKFSKLGCHGPFKPARLVWLGPGETPPAPAAGETPPPPEARPDAPPADAAAAAVAQAERSARVAERSAAGQPDPAEAEAVLRQLMNELPIEAREGLAPITVEQIETALKKFNPEQLLRLDTVLNSSVTDQEKLDFQKKFSTDGVLDWKKIIEPD